MTQLGRKKAASISHKDANNNNDDRFLYHLCKINDVVIVCILAKCDYIRIP